MQHESMEGTCPECNGNHLVQDHEHAEVLCSDCGLVVSDSLIYSGPTWSVDTNDHRDYDQTHTGSPTSVLLHDKGLTTQIGWHNKDAHGQYIPYRSRPQMYRLRRLQHRVRMSKSSDRALAQGLVCISSVSGRLGLPKQIRQQAAVIFRRAQDCRIPRGHSISEVATASVYAACRQAGVPRTLEEVMDVDESRKSIGMIYRILARKLGLKIQIQSPGDYIPRFCDKLELDHAVVTRCNDVAQGIHGKMGFGSSNPIGVAAGIIYNVCLEMDIYRTQKDIATLVGVTEVTLRTNLRKLEKVLEVG